MSHPNSTKITLTCPVCGKEFTSYRTAKRKYCSVDCFNVRTAKVPAIAIERFWARVEKTDTCWNWKGAKNSGGYGHLQIAGTHHMAHRLAYELVKGPIPDGMHLDHDCKNRGCVNPDHTEPVTPKVNLSRSDAPSAINSRKTHCIRGHEFTPDNTLWEGHKRRCRTCRDKRERERTIRRRLAGTWRVHPQESGSPR